MKATFFLQVVLLLFVYSGLSSCSSNDEEQRIEAKDLPSAAQSFIKTHFPEAETVSIALDPKDQYSQYEVSLNNGFDLDFDKNGRWTEIEGHGEKVPDSVVPKPILAYVTANYSDSFIEEISKEASGYKVDLSNDVDLQFDEDGNFTGMDP